MPPRAEQDDRAADQPSEPKVSHVLPGEASPRHDLVTNYRQGTNCASREPAHNVAKRHHGAANTFGESNPETAPEQGIHTGTQTTKRSPPQNHWSQHDETRGGAEGNRTPDLLDANSRHGGRGGLFPLVYGRCGVLPGSVGRRRCCTSLLYSDGLDLLAETSRARASRTRRGTWCRAQRADEIRGLTRP